MPAYEICYLDGDGILTYKFMANCENESRAKVLAHAMKLPSCKCMEVWNGEVLVYARPASLAHEIAREAALRAP